MRKTKKFALNDLGHLDTMVHILSERKNKIFKRLMKKGMIKFAMPMPMFGINNRNIHATQGMQYPFQHVQQNAGMHPIPGMFPHVGEGEDCKNCEAKNTCPNSTAKEDKKFDKHKH